MSSAGRYEIHSEIASGGMARVHFGRLRGDQGFQRVVAIKRMHPKLARDPKLVAMFRDEALLAARIRHPNVVTTLDVVSDGADVFIVMEYVRGLPLSILLARAKRSGEAIPVPIAVSILCGVLAGLHAAHEAHGLDGAPLSIVHRDVSPQNILVDIDGVARVVDFGIAKANAQLHTTMEGELKGKLAFMAPEQILAGPVDRRVDVFAAGVVGYSMLTGAPLFSQGEVDEVRDRVLHMQIPRLVERRPDAGDAVSAAIARALERDRAARYATARDFEIAVEDAFDRLASARQVGAWVERHGRELLADRDREVARIESGATDGPEQSEGPLEITSTDAPTVDLLDEPARAASDAMPSAVYIAGDEAVTELGEAVTESGEAVTESDDATRRDRLVAEEPKHPIASEAPPDRRRRLGRLPYVVSAATLAIAGGVALWVAGRATELEGGAATTSPSEPATAPHDDVRKSRSQIAIATTTSSSLEPPKAAANTTSVVVTPAQPSSEPSASTSDGSTRAKDEPMRLPTARKPSGYFPARP